MVLNRFCGYHASFSLAAQWKLPYKTELWIEVEAQYINPVKFKEKK